MNNVETVAYELYAELERKLERAESALAGAHEVNTRHALRIRELEQENVVHMATVAKLEQERDRLAYDNEVMKEEIKEYQREYYK